MTPTIGSLFAGIGGFDLGFERAGFRTVWQCEIDKAAQGVLRRHFPDAELHSDVREVGAHNLAPVDALTFGSPCQDLSVAGKRAGLAGERSGLFHEAARIIRELRERYGKPDFAIWENVPGAFSSNGGADFAAVVQAMVDLGARDVCWRVLDSRYFGVAQRRRRVFLVADFGGERAEQILFEPESLRGDIAPRRKARKEAAGSARAGVAGGGDFGRIAQTLSTRDHKGVSCGRDGLVGNPVVVPFYTTQITSPSNYSSPKAGDPCHPLAAGAHPPAVAFAQNTRDEVRLMGGDGQIAGALAAQPGMKQTTYVAQPITLEVRGRDGECSLEYRQDGTANCLRGASGGRGGTGIGAVAVAQPIAFHPTQDPISSQDGVTQSIGFNWQNGGGYGAANDGLGITHEGTGPLQRCQTPAVAGPTMQVRRLTPTECERLQGFPDGWTVEATLSDGTVKQQADGPRYKQLGNAVTVNVAEWIARRVRGAL